MMEKEVSPHYTESIRNWPEGERPREKLMCLGAESLSNAELLAILIRTGTRQQSAVDLAKGILSRYGQLHDLSAMSSSELSRMYGFGPAKAVTLIAAFELGRRMAIAPRRDRLKITEPETVYKRYSPQLSHLKKERFLILVLNSANILMRDIQISEGILNASLVHPREVFKAAILETAASIILLHNHPSGEVKPSLEDESITQRMVEAGQLLNIPVLDHIIIGSRNFYSFREAGLIT